MPNFPEWLVALETIEDNAVASFNNEEYENAFNAYEKLRTAYSKLNTKRKKTINYDAKIENILAQLGRCQSALGNKREALAYFYQVLECQPARLDVRWEIALILDKLGETEAAHQCAKRIIYYDKSKYLALDIQNLPSIETLNRDCHLLLGNAALKQKYFDKAKKYYQAIPCYAKLAEIAYIDRDFSVAITYSKKAIGDIDIKTTQSEKQIAYYYWGRALLSPFETNTKLDQSERNIVGLAIKLIQKSIEIEGNKNAFFSLGYLYDEKKYGHHDADKALEYYVKAANLGSPEALHNLGYKYLDGEGVDRDLTKAFNFYQLAAEMDYAPAQTDLAKCYVEGTGCAIDLNEAKKWAEKASVTSPLAKHYLGSLLLLEFEETHEAALKPKIEKLLTEAAEEDIASANFNLGYIYTTGTIFEKNFEKAEYYYRHAIRLGEERAFDNLLLLYLRHLMVAQMSDADYETIESACHEMLKERFQNHDQATGESLIEAIQHLNLVKHSNCVLASKDLSSIRYSRDYSADEKINLILDRIAVKNADTINLATTVLKLGELFDQCGGSQFIFDQNKQRIEVILIACQDKLKAGAFSERGISNLIVGISKFYRHAYQPCFDVTLKALYQYFLNKHNLPLITLSSVIAAATRTRLESNVATNVLAHCVKIFHRNLHFYIKNNDDISSVIYHVAVLDNYRRQCPEFALTIQDGFIKAITIYAVKTAVDMQFSYGERYQCFLVAVYFCNEYPHLIDDALLFDLASLATAFKTNTPEVKISALQKKIYCFLQKFLPGCVAEFVINTLPVDIFYKGYVIQVDGPHHYIFINTDNDHQLSAKDVFHDTLLNCAFDQQKTVKNVVIHIDYVQYNQKGNDYLKSALSEQGLTLVSQGNNKSFTFSKQKPSLDTQTSYQESAVFELKPS